ncbi:formyltransferase family protein [Rhizobium straminoryzae]|uniref:Methionyl-tRNA formyltransferase n=1 Tax=Rhizobium straminoryzae TaxID=1387186 RepID=A0A549T857_9HYPH|nr:formyltransferase family protein [Rhizobium straminoryzae]TRL38045.1 methionyl-tRNA formyltransferase [Rhizobium straminoryzae]
MKIGLIGQKWLAAEVFKALNDHHDMAFVAVPRASDRLYALAMAADVPAILYGSTGLDALAGISVDLLICANAFVFVPAWVRQQARDTIGFHPSLLPLHRGRTAVADVIAAGERITGGTVYHLTDEMDGGPVAFQDWCFIQENETPADLWRRALAPMGLELLTRAVDHLAVYGFIPAEEQAIL